MRVPVQFVLSADISDGPNDYWFVLLISWLDILALSPFYIRIFYFYFVITKTLTYITIFPLWYQNKLL